jgi:hypothetical protein
MKNMLLLLVTTVFSLNTANADVRVEITRNLPEGTQIIVQEFNDTEEFAMWMATRLDNDEGCKPGVTKINIDLDYKPVWKQEK